MPWTSTAVLAHFADDATLTVQTDHVTFTGADEIRRMFTDFFAASKTIGHEIRNIVVEEAAGKVATEQGYIGELHDGSLNDMHNCNFFDFDDGREVQAGHHLDGRHEPPPLHLPQSGIRSRGFRTRKP